MEKSRCSPRPTRRQPSAQAIGSLAALPASVVPSVGTSSEQAGQARPSCAPRRHREAAGTREKTGQAGLEGALGSATRVAWCNPDHRLPWGGGKPGPVGRRAHLPPRASCLPEAPGPNALAAGTGFPNCEHQELPSVPGGMAPSVQVRGETLPRSSSRKGREGSG